MNKIKETNDKLTTFLNKCTSFLTGRNQKHARRKMYNSLWAVFFGLAISGIFISFLGVNPFSAYSTFLTTSIFSSFAPTRYFFTTVFAVLMIASIGMAIGFKSGIFNIGISGQMMMSGTVGMMIVLGFQNNGTEINAGIVLLAFLVGILSAVALGAIVGVLKAFLNVHEVVSTILLNWVVVFIASYIFTSTSTPFSKSDSTGSIQINSSDFSYINTWWVWLILAFFIVIITWVIMSKTTIGYRVKVNGLSKEASKYAGTNEKLMTVSIISISAGFAGLAGSIYYISFVGLFPAPGQPLLLGFNTIAISLLAYNSPIGLVFSSLLYAILESGNLQLLGISNEAREIVGGIIIYLAALSTLFLNFKLFTFTKNYIILFISKDYKNLLKNYRKQKKELNLEKKRLIQNERKMLMMNKSQIVILNKKMKLLEKGISPELSILDVKTTEDSLNYFDNISKNKQIIKEQLQELNYYEISRIKNNFKSDFKEIKVLYKSQIAEIYNEKNKIYQAMIINKMNSIFKRGGK